MGKLLRTAVAGLIVLFPSIAAAQSYVVDFTDSDFAVVVDSGINGVPVVFTETVGGATLTFESTANLVGITRFINLVPMQTSSGIQIGGGGGSTLQFTLSSNVDMILDTFDGSGNAGVSPPIFDVTGPGVSSVGNTVPIVSATSPFNGGPLSLQANDLYTFSVTNGGALTQGFLRSFGVTVIPEPSSATLVFVASLAGCLTRRRR